MNVFTNTPAQVVAAIMAELKQAKRPRMVMVDHHADVHIVRADSLMGQQHFARHPEHWVGTWNHQARRPEVAHQLFTRMLQLVAATMDRPRRRGTAPRDPFRAGCLPIAEPQLPLQRGRAAA